MPEARADLVANQVELTWLTRYPNKITVNIGKEFLAKFKTIMVNDYGIPCTHGVENEKYPLIFSLPQLSFYL